MQQIDSLEAYKYLFDMQVNDEHTKQIWLDNAGGAITTMLIGQLPNSKELIEKIKNQAKNYGLGESLDKYIERINSILDIQKGLSISNGQLDLQKLFKITDGKKDF